MKFFIKFKSKLLLSIFFFSSIFIISCGDDNSDTGSPIAAVKAYELPASLDLTKVSPLDTSPKMDKSRSGSTTAVLNTRAAATDNGGYGYGDEVLFGVLINLEFEKLNLLHILMLANEYYDQFSECTQEPCFKELSYTSAMAKTKLAALEDLDKEFGYPISHGDVIGIVPKSLPSCMKQSEETGYTHSLSVYYLNDAETECTTDLLMNVSYNLTEGSDLMDIKVLHYGKDKVKPLYEIQVANSEENKNAYTYAVNGENDFPPVDFDSMNNEVTEQNSVDSSTEGSSDEIYYKQVFSIDAFIDKQNLAAKLDFKTLNAKYSDANRTMATEKNRFRIEGILSIEKGADITIYEDDRTDVPDEAPYKNIFKEKYTKDGDIAEAKKFDSNNKEWGEADHVSQEHFADVELSAHEKLYISEISSYSSKSEAEAAISDAKSKMGILVLVAANAKDGATDFPYCEIDLEAETINFGSGDETIIFADIDPYKCVGQFDQALQNSSEFSIAFIKDKVLVKAVYDDLYSGPDLTIPFSYYFDENLLQNVYSINESDSSILRFVISN